MHSEHMIELPKRSMVDTKKSQLGIHNQTYSTMIHEDRRLEREAVLANSAHTPDQFTLDPHKSYVHLSSHMPLMPN